jgi:hypothetical protein
MRVESAEQKRKKEEERREREGERSAPNARFLLFLKLERQIPVIFGF